MSQSKVESGVPCLVHYEAAACDTRSVHCEAASVVCGEASTSSLSAAKESRLTAARPLSSSVPSAPDAASLSRRGSQGPLRPLRPLRPTAAFSTPPSRNRPQAVLGALSGRRGKSTTLPTHTDTRPACRPRMKGDSRAARCNLRPGFLPSLAGAGQIRGVVKTWAAAVQA